MKKVIGIFLGLVFLTSCISYTPKEQHWYFDDIPLGRCVGVLSYSPDEYYFSVEHLTYSNAWIAVDERTLRITLQRKEPTYE